MLSSSLKVLTRNPLPSHGSNPNFIYEAWITSLFGVMRDVGHRRRGDYAFLLVSIRF
jgi:hypothetical protein